VLGGEETDEQDESGVGEGALCVVGWSDVEVVLDEYVVRVRERPLGPTFIAREIRKHSRQTP